MIFLFNYLKLALWSGIYYYQRSDLVFDIIIKNINDCGCLAIKFTQWVLPKIELIYDLDSKEDKWFGELERFYEYNNIHGLKYTEDTYKNDFNEGIEETYEIQEIIGSGSIGQVYKVKHKITGELYAIKVTHPNMRGQILFLKYVLFFLMKTPLIKDKFCSMLPFNLYDFINDFKDQTDMVHEANNCMKFYEFHKEDELVVIPRVSKVSRNILIMSYEEGVRFDDLDISDYSKYKCIVLINSFIKNNQIITNFSHGDIHKGNWKIRVCGNKCFLILYDFGFCWKMPYEDIGMIEFIDNTFIKMDNGNQYTEDIIKISKFLLSEKCSDELIRNEMDGITMTINPDVLFKFIITVAQKERIVLDSILLQVLICLTQLTKYLEKYSLIRSEETYETGYLGYEYYRKRLLDIKSFCESNKIFKEYVAYIDEKIKKYNPEINDLFETVETENNFKDYSFLKEMALS